MSNRREQVLDLVEQWSRLSEQGQSVGVVALCAGCPELLPELERHLRFLRQLDSLVVPEEEDTTPTLLEGLAVLAERMPVIPNHDVLGLLGAGGMGAVYRAHDRRLGRTVALKVIREGLAGPVALARFQAEAESLARLNHPHVVQVYEVGRFCSEHGALLPYLALEHVEGDNLEQRLRRHAVEPIEAVELLRLLARAVQVAHDAGIVHRDLKPGNVLLAAPAAEPSLNCALGCPKITDFGLARYLTGDGLPRSGAVLGTPGYVAPEQVAGAADVGTAADVYGLGAILYRLLAGQPPIPDSDAAQALHRAMTEPPVPVRHLRPSAPPELDALCLRCLEKNPARRPTVPELVEALERFLAPTAQPRARRTWRLVLALLLCPLLLAGGLACALGLTGSPHDEGPLQVRSLRVLHHARTPDGKRARTRVLGEKSFVTIFGDAVTLSVEFSRPACFYLVAFNANGKEQLLWPADDNNRPLPATRPAQLSRLRFPLGGKRFTLNDEPNGGVQVFAVLASRRPLPGYAEWARQRGPVAWGRHKPIEEVWLANEEEVREAAPGEKPLDRDRFERPLGAPPLERLCAALRVGEVEVVEAVAFGVLPGEGP
jgi:serine/threonine protein kinase